MADYFSKHGEFIPQIAIEPNKELGIVVVIPSFNEPNLELSLDALKRCELPQKHVEVIVVVNYPERSSHDVIENAKQSIDIVNRANSGNSALVFHSILSSNLPKKHAGVGLARKIGMDEAAWRLVKVNHPEGIIACYDADAKCSSNYLIELEKLWESKPKTTACSIRFEHPISGDEFDKKIYHGITLYELHLRYYYQASKYIKFPFAYHTIGSSMACTAETYIKFGGMNKHQAGEDFYFLQKIIPHGNFQELNSTCIYPSPRPSYRVPFGTGRAMLKYLQNQEETILTYDFNCWLTLIPLFQNIDNLYRFNNLEIQYWAEQLHPALSKFLATSNFIKKINEVKANTSSLDSFRKRFFFWFDAFALLKYLNFAHEKYFQRKPIEEESILLANKIGLKLPSKPNPADILKAYRNKELNP